MSTPQMTLQETIDFWQREVDRDAADPRERTRDGVASSTLYWLREYAMHQQSQLGAPVTAHSPLANEYVPNYTSPPSETLREIMADRGWTRSMLAAALNVTSGYVDAMMHDAYEYTPDLCAKLEAATGVGAAFWRRRWEAWRDAQLIDGITPENVHGAPGTE